MSVGVTRDVGQRSKLLNYQSIDIPTLNYGHERVGVRERERVLIHATLHILLIQQVRVKTERKKEKKLLHFTS